MRMCSVGKGLAGPQGDALMGLPGRRGRRATFASALLTGAILLTVLGACGDREERVRAEARGFLTLYEATDHRSPIPERERKVAQLEQLTLSDEAVRKTRDACVEAHRTLIRAERENEEASGLLEKAVGAQVGGEPLPVAEAERIRARLTAAEGSIAESRKRFEQCESDTRSLSLRFGKR